MSLSAGDPTTYVISGELCATPAELTNGETVQLLIHGATYNHTYWDFGTVDGIQYSYARDVAAAGYPTFAIDEIGTAETRPIVPSTEVTLNSVAYVAHEIIQDLTAGRITGVRFGKVIEVGHSEGSYTSWVEAATYHDVAGVIITGAAHAFSATATALLGSAFTPGADPGYVTTVQGTRGSVFYAAGDSDPNVIARDEATKDEVSSTLANEALPLVQTAITEQISAPVLVVLGSKDALFCGTEASGATFNCSSGADVASEEGPYYSPQAQLRACVVPGSGHDINLALNHDVEEADALAWSDEYVGQRGVPAVPARVLPPGCSR